MKTGGVWWRGGGHGHTHAHCHPHKGTEEDTLDRHILSHGIPRAQCRRWVRAAHPTLDAGRRGVLRSERRSSPFPPGNRCENWSPHPRKEPEISIGASS
ncbi:unnamed protein product, partial [Iphiclides podalirius]